MKKGPFGRGCLPVVCILVAVLASSLHAQPSAPVSPELSYNLAVQALNRNDFQEALNRIQTAITARPEDLTYQYVLGIVYSRLQRWEEAEGIFLALVQRDEVAFRSVYFDLAYIYLQKGEAEKALEMVEKARPVDPGRASYEAGVIYLHLKKYKEAADSFKQAPLEKPELAALAMTQQAVALFHLKEYKQARNLLEKVLEMKLSLEREEEVKKMLEAIDAAYRAHKPWHVSATVGYQFDSNVFQTPLQRANFQVVRETDKDKDAAGFLASVTGRYNLFQTDPWKLGVGYAHYSLTYGDHSDLDAVGARPSVYIEWSRAPYSADLQYIYSHYWVGGVSWLDAHSLLPRFAVSHGERWRTEIVGGTEWHYYNDITPDDVLYFVGATETLLLREGKANLRAGYLAGLAELTPSDAADYVFHEALLGVQWPVWKDKWFVDLSGRYIWRDFEFNPAFSLTEERRDEEKNLNLYLYGQVTNHVQLAFLFQHIWSDSNIEDVGNLELFNFRRAVFTCMLTFSY